MAVVETLDVILAAKTAQFNKDMQKEAGSVGRFKKQFESSALGGFDVTNIRGSLASLPALAGPAGIAIGAAFAGATAAIAGAGVALSKIHAEMARIDEISDTANKLGLTFAELETVRQSFAQSSGLGFDAIDSAMQKFQLGLAEAANSGSGDVFDKLSAAGLNAAELIKMGPVLALKEVAKATQEMQNPTDQLVLAYELFGKQGADLVSSLREGPEALNQMAQFAEQTGLALSQAQAEQVGAANDAFERMQNIGTGAWRQISAEAAPVLTVIYDSVTEIGMSFGGWNTTLPEIVDTVAQFAGLMYDIYEVATLTQKTLYNIATLDFSEVGDAFKDAMDFTTGDKFQAKIVEARNQAKAEAEKKSVGKSFNAESVIAEYDRKKEEEKRLADDRKKQEQEVADAKKKRQEEDDKKRDRAISIAKQFDPTIAMQESFAEIQSLFQEGFLSKSMAEKATLDAAGKATPDYKGAVSAQQGSVEAYKLIVEKENQNNQQAAIKQIAQRQLDVLNKIANSGSIVKVAR